MKRPGPIEKRQQYVDQSVSLNLAFPSQASPKWINQIHIEAWKQGIKTLYYSLICKQGAKEEDEEFDLPSGFDEFGDDEDCLACKL